ncbi:tripartite tricarboxylate transporter TctB family protein [Brevibacillus borstelensis]|uniref:tripartite tricarboxylate transporter TctB family protein n=1 Tax=Brevibacillus borstelensis TaxID=45462 RepID=UPI0030BF74B6
MRLPYNMPDFLGALLSIAIGIAVSLEACRLQAYSPSTYVGDHTLPAVLGILLIVLGAGLLFHSFRDKKEERKTDAEGGFQRKSVLPCLLVLLGYGLAIDLLGYVLATFLASIALFRIIGSYKWSSSIAMAIVLTGCLYAVFIVWLKIAFPTGFFF